MMQNDNLDENQLEEDSTHKRKCFPIYVEAYPAECHVEPYDDFDISEYKAMSISEIMFSADSLTKRSSARIGNFESDAQTSFRSSVVNEASVASEFEFNQENAS